MCYMPSFEKKKKCVLFLNGCILPPYQGVKSEKNSTNLPNFSFQVNSNHFTNKVITRIEIFLPLKNAYVHLVPQCYIIVRLKMHLHHHVSNKYILYFPFFSIQVLFSLQYIFVEKFNKTKYFIFANAWTPVHCIYLQNLKPLRFLLINHITVQLYNMMCTRYIPVLQAVRQGICCHLLLKYSLDFITFTRIYLVSLVCCSKKT